MSKAAQGKPAVEVQTSVNNEQDEAAKSAQKAKQEQEQHTKLASLLGTDAHAGKGGRYMFDPATNTRIAIDEDGKPLQLSASPEPAA